MGISFWLVMVEITAFRGFQGRKFLTAIKKAQKTGLFYSKTNILYIKYPTGIFADFQ